MAIPETVTAFRGLTTDHLYDTCPSLVRSVERQPLVYGIGQRLQGEVDPLGTDICGWCQRVWIARNKHRIGGNE